MCSINDLSYVVFSASGSKGFVFEGILECLEDNMPMYNEWNHSLKGVAGTSGGALMCLIVALGIIREKRINIFKCLCDFNNILQCPDVTLIIENYGLEDGKALRVIVQDILILGGLSGASTMSDMKRLLRLDIVFVAHNLNTGYPVHISASTFPDMPVADAVFASCCIPLLFTPLKYKGLLLCDGMLSESVPDVFPVNSTLHVITPFTTSKEIDNLYSFLSCLTLSATNHQNSRILHLMKLENTICATHPFLDEICSIEPHMDTTLMDTIQQCGYVACLLYLYNKTHLLSAVHNLVKEYIHITSFVTLASQESLCENEGDPDS